MRELVTKERLDRRAESRKGRCLSPEYLGIGKKHQWQCSEGHIWNATVNQVIHRHTWCPICAKKNRDRRVLGLSV